MAGGAPHWRDTTLTTEAVVVAATGADGVVGVPEVNLGGPGGEVGARDPI